jgi:hypothetical protein
MLGGFIHIAKIILSPNPSAGLIEASITNLEFENSLAELIVNSTTGQTVQYIHISQDEIAYIDGSELMPGLYIVSVMLRGEVKSIEKLVIQP